jgi:ABC-type polysaccharide/polyol phosphate transport system ATPase subunit
MSDTDVVIRVEGLGKKYSLHHEQSERYTALRDVVARQARAAGRLLNPFTLAGQLRRGQRHAAKDPFVSDEEFWALKDVSFEIRRGERVGIIGRNGAGKSTLLKILSRITEPTTGRVEICGRVASLLEVGTGFHPELTGRENIYLNGAILGMTRREIRSKFDAIVDFAEVEKFLDTPVKRYSSGMYVRLAFAVAAYLEPEILVVDEVLAVGDASFQKKCLGKMEDVADREGRTVLFVSHSIIALKALCNVGILLESGCVKDSGGIIKVISSYQSGGSSLLSCYEKHWPRSGSGPGSEEMRLVSISVKQSGREGPFADDIPIQIHVSVECDHRSSAKSVGVVVVDEFGNVALHLESSATRGSNKSLKSGINYLIFELPPGVFKAGRYTLRAVGTEPMVRLHYNVQDVLGFEIETDDHEFVRHGLSAWLATSSPKIALASLRNNGLSHD